MIKRDTKVEVVILENGKYVLLKHVFKTENRVFWNLPGGGKEQDETDEFAAIREAEEETYLKVNLLPHKIDYNCDGIDPFYKRKVIFMAYPISGIAKTGYDPEPWVKDFAELTDLRWQDFYDDNDIDSIVMGHIKPLRDYMNTNPFPVLSSSLIYKMLDNKAHYLLLNNIEPTNNLAIPFVINNNNENAKDLISQIKDKYNININIIKKSGFSFVQYDGQAYQLNVYISSLQDDNKLNDNYKWLTFDDIKNSNISRAIKRTISDFNHELMNSL